MNIFVLEIKSEFKFFIIWTISLLLTLVAFMMGIYPVFTKSLEEVEKVLSGFPPQFSAAFGFNIEDLFSYGGFYSFTFVYIALIGAIMAVSIALAIFAREKRSKCADFLLSKPVNRRKIFGMKLLSSIAILVAANIIYIIAAMLIFISSSDKTISLGTLAVAASSLFFTQLVFLALGVLFAIYSKKIRSVSGIATAFGFGAYILSALGNIIQEESLYFIAPLKYFDPYSLFRKGNFEIKYTLAATIVIVICLSLAYVRFCKSDAHAV